MTSSSRFDRQIALFGHEGQEKIRAARPTILGTGGLGTHLAQQLALLGVGEITLVDDQELDETNKNRYVGVYRDDPVPGSWKIDLAERLVLLIDPSIRVSKVCDNFVSEPGFAAIREATHVFGCLDRDGYRMILNEVCCAHAKPYFDLASEVIPGERAEFGGRVAFTTGGNGCLHCLRVIDLAEVQHDLGGEGMVRLRQSVYGVDAEYLGRTGPSVVSINGVVASLAVTEFMALVTGLRAPVRLLTYYGHRGAVTVGADAPPGNCYYCKGLWGRPDVARLERFLRSRE